MKKTFVVCSVILMMLLIGTISQAQKIRQDSIFLTGAVLDQVDLSPLPYAHFKVNMKRAGTSNAFGRFSFWVNSGDTIKYSYVGYQDARIVVSDSLQEDDYLFGVFLGKDTIALPEVVILPRFGDFKEAFMNSKVNTPEYVRAKNNVNSATYVALTTRPKKMDAKANTDMLINKHVEQIEYKVGVAPGSTVGVSMGQTLPELQRLKRKKSLKIPDDIITDDEVKTLQQMYKYGNKKKK